MNRLTRAADATWIVAGEILGFFVQLWLIALGAQYVFFEDDPDEEVVRLLAWCLVGTLYLIAVIIWLNIDLHVRKADHALMRRIASWRVIRWISGIFTFGTSFLGFSTAITLLVIHADPNGLVDYEIAAVWAMLLAWATFHWGFARIYHSRYYLRDADKPLIFPRTETPRLVDFVYFSYTVGTSFAPSDVSVATSRMRWTVVWHNVFSFFFNALIIVLAINTITGGIESLSTH